MALSNVDPKYADLLRQVTELQSDLSKTVAACHGLRSECDATRTNYDKLKEEHVELRSRYAQVRRQALEEAQAKVTVEQEHEQLVKTWRSQLEQKAQEFEQLQESLAPPRDLDMLRIKIQEELEAPHLAKVQVLQGEIEHYRALFFNVRREHELLKTEFEQFTIDQGKEAESTHDAHVDEVKELKRQLATMQVRLESASQSEALRSLQREIDALHAEREKMAEESADLRRQKEEAKIELEQARVTHAREAAEQGVQLKTLGADVATLERKCQVAQADARRAEEARNSVAATIAGLEADVARMKHAVEDAESRATDERLRGEKLLLEASSAADRERHELRAAAEAAERRLVTAESRHAEALDGVHAAAKSDAAESARETRRLEEALRQAEAEVERLRSELDTTTRGSNGTRREHAEQLERASAEVEAVSADCRRLEREKMVLASQIRAAKEKHETALAVTRRDGERYQELEREYAALQLKHREQIIALNEASTSRDHLENSVALLERDISTLREANERLEEECQAARKTAKSARDEMEDAVTGTKAHMLSLLDSERANWHAMSERTGRKHRAYRDALIKCKHRIRELNSKRAGLEGDLRREHDARQTELASMQRQLKDAERQRELELRSLGALGGLGDSELGDLGAARRTLTTRGAAKQG